MNDTTSIFGETATRLSRNPLSIIALFIVFIYAFAGLITAFSGALSVSERLPLIYFLVLFPVLVLGVFAWLVSSHGGKLFAPADFRDESNYVRMHSTAVASLAIASAKSDTGGRAMDINEIVGSVTKALSPKVSGVAGATVLWVDDNPEGNIFVRRAFEAIDIEVQIARSTVEALTFLAENPVGVIISDMGRGEGPREGYTLLDEVRRRQISTPFFVYAGSNKPEHRREVFEHGGQGTTNNAQELFQMVVGALFTRAEPHHA
jgi:CheY-like chemotaxis protein